MDWNQVKEQYEQCEKKDMSLPILKDENSTKLFQETVSKKENFC